MQVGATAAQDLFGAKFKITNERGKIMEDTGIAPTVMATVHPSSVLRAPDHDAREKARREFTEDLAKAGTAETTQTTQKPAEAEGPNRIAIKPLKKTYIKVVVDNESLQPAFERWISPSDGTVEFRGQKIAVRVLDRDAIQIRKNGKPVSGDDDDVTVE